MTSPAQTLDKGARPSLASIDGDQLNTLLARWLGRPYLEEVVLVTFAFDPSYELMSTTLAKRLTLLAETVSVTFVTTRGRSKSELANKRAYRHAQMLNNLSAAGIRIFINDDLHAKVYLFKEHEKVCWIVGSSNLTSGGLGDNQELNVRGYRVQDYHQVFQRVETIINESKEF